jgi:hypothetical protein
MGILVDYFTRPSSPGFGRGWQNMPDANGHFGTYGGRFVAETLMPLLLELEAAYLEARQQPEFWAELEGIASSIMLAAPARCTTPNALRRRWVGHRCGLSGMS